MSDKIISTDIIKEISQQLQLLYGHATNDLLPIVLHAISQIHLFNIISTMLSLILTAFFIYLVSIPLYKHAKKELEEDDMSFFAFLMQILNFILPFIFWGCMECMLNNLCYIFCPEAKIIKVIMGI